MDKTKRVNAEDYVNMHRRDRLTVKQFTAVLRAMQHVDPLAVFDHGEDRKAFRNANRKMVRLWNQARLEKENKT